MKFFTQDVINFKITVMLEILTLITFFVYKKLLIEEKFQLST